MDHATSTEGSPPVADRPEWHVPRLREDDRMIGGVASGIGEEIGVPPLVIRACFVVLATTGWGILLYGLAWAGLALYGYNHPEVATEPRSPKGANPTTRLIGVGLVFSGILFLVRSVDIGFEDAIVWPVALLALGVVVAWDRGVLDGEGEDRTHVIVRIGIGLALAIGGLVVLVSSNLDRSATVTAIGAVVVVGIGLAVVLGPWVWRTLNDLAEERRRRIRSEERADVAAHLHDSVLQTLALIQRQSDDPQAMVSLARSQERELRDWLFTDDNGTVDGIPLRRVIADTAAEVEQLHHVPIEVVTVGDLDMGDDHRLAALVAATREAMTNAARHSGATSVDVYAEVTPERVEVFVRDTGAGFEPETVADDRRGLADSVVGRMRRAGGTATIDTMVGEGTEVSLTLERETAT